MATTPGSATLLGYPQPHPNAVQRLAQQAAATRALSWVLARTSRYADRALARASDNRVTLAGLVTGLPVVHLTTTGARTGLRRTSPLIPVVLGGDLVVLGTNYGGARTPGWVANLEAEPAAAVAFSGRRVDVTARPAGPDEEAAAWALARATYPGFGVYPARAGHRRIRVFVLTAAPQPSTGTAAPP